MDYLIATGVATGAWFITAALLFFNPPVDKIYNKESEHPAVRILPKNGGTIAKILYCGNHSVCIMGSRLQMDT